MNDNRVPSESKIKELVYSFCQAISSRNSEKLENLFADQTKLYWGPYEFIGKENILNWANELYDLFPFISIKEKALKVQELTAKHEFLIAFLTSQGRQGWLPCEANYTFIDDKISQLKINLLHGFLSVSQDEVERVRPHPTRT